MFYEENHCIRCAALDVPALRHGFATRSGGVSEGCFSSMNLGYRRGDDQENVAQNYELLGSYIGVSMEKLLYLKQVHGATVHIADGKRQALDRDGDGLITNIPELPIACYYGDCVPILLYDPSKKAIAAVHSGWRGTLQNILETTVAKMTQVYGTCPQSLIAAVGPSIGSCHMEVGREVQALFDRKPFGCTVSRGGKLYLDLWTMVRLQLLQAGLEERNIHVAGLCTYCHPESFYSHRRDGEKRGNHCAVIQLVSEEKNP